MVVSKKSVVSPGSSAGSKLLSVAVDFGNRNTVLVCGDQVLSFRSSIAYDCWVTSVNPADSRTVSISHSDTLQALVGKPYTIGLWASRQPTAVNTFESEKPLQALPFLLAMLPEGEDLELDLKVVCSRPELELNEYLKYLKGSHSFDGLNGVQSVTIRTVETVQEGLGPYNLAKRKNLLVPDTYTAVINFGGGSLDGILFNPEGDIELGARFNDLQAGTLQLARSIGELMERYGRVNETPKLTLIMDALEKGSDRYGKGPNSVLINDLIQRAIEPWFTRCMGLLESKWHKYYESIGRCVLTGGTILNPYVLAPFENNPYFMVTEDPLKDNVLHV